MGFHKNYLLKVITETTEDVEQQDAVEYAIFSKWVALTYDIEKDKLLIQRELPAILEKFRRIAAENQTINAPLAELVSQIHDWK